MVDELLCIQIVSATLLLAGIFTLLIHGQLGPWLLLAGVLGVIWAKFLFHARKKCLVESDPRHTEA